MRKILAIWAMGLLMLSGLPAHAERSEIRKLELEGQTQRHKAAHEQAVELRLVGFTAKRERSQSRISPWIPRG
jgi:hypothetical protein